MDSGRQVFSNAIGGFSIGSSFGRLLSGVKNGMLNDVLFGDVVGMVESAFVHHSAVNKIVNGHLESFGDAFVEDDIELIGDWRGLWDSVQDDVANLRNSAGQNLKYEDLFYPISDLATCVAYMFGMNVMSERNYCSMRAWSLAERAVLAGQNALSAMTSTVMTNGALFAYNIGYFGPFIGIECPQTLSVEGCNEWWNQTLSNNKWAIDRFGSVSNMIFSLLNYFVKNHWKPKKIKTGWIDKYYKTEDAGVRNAIAVLAGEIGNVFDIGNDELHDVVVLAASASYGYINCILQLGYTYKIDVDKSVNGNVVWNAVDFIRPDGSVDHAIVPDGLASVWARLMVYIAYAAAFALCASKSGNNWNEVIVMKKL